MATDLTGVGAVLSRPTPEPFDEAMTYDEIVRREGGRYDPATGALVRIVPDGQYPPYKRPDGTWGQRTQKRFIARSPQEARDKNDMRWDAYVTGAKCPKSGCNTLLSGWARGGRKLEREHEHIMYDSKIGGVELDMTVDAPDGAEVASTAKSGAKG